MIQGQLPHRSLTSSWAMMADGGGRMRRVTGFIPRQHSAGLVDQQWVRLDNARRNSAFLRRLLGFQRYPDLCQRHPHLHDHESRLRRLQVVRAELQRRFELVEAAEILMTSMKDHQMMAAPTTRMSITRRMSRKMMMIGVVSAEMTAVEIAEMIVATTDEMTEMMIDEVIAEEMTGTTAGNRRKKM